MTCVAPYELTGQTTLVKLKAKKIHCSLRRHHASICHGHANNGSMKWMDGYLNNDLCDDHVTAALAGPSQPSHVHHNGRYDANQARCIEHGQQGVPRPARRSIQISLPHIPAAHDRPRRRIKWCDTDLMHPHINRPCFCVRAADLCAILLCLPSGVTYNREAIQRWFEMGHNTCPITRRRVVRDCFPNLLVRSDIVEWLHHQGRDPEVQSVCTESTQVRACSLHRLMKWSGPAPQQKQQHAQMALAPPNVQYRLTCRPCKTSWVTFVRSTRDSKPTSAIWQNSWLHCHHSSPCCMTSCPLLTRCAHPTQTHVPLLHALRCAATMFCVSSRMCTISVR